LASFGSFDPVYTLYTPPGTHPGVHLTRQTAGCPVGVPHVHEKDPPAMGRAGKGSF